jgi:tetratricopeptide (TPR) repeat protein
MRALSVRFARLLSRIALITALSVGSSGTVAARDTSLRLDPAGMRQLALTALQSGRPDVVLRLTEALLQRDPEDLMALVLRARVLRDIGRYDEALSLARKAWAGARTTAQRHSIALIMAQALSSSGRRGQAQIWLRRAAHEAPTPAARARVEQDFAYVRSRNPLSVELSFSAAPSNNVNSGSQHRRMGLDEFLPGLPGSHLIFTDRPVDMTALPGWVLQGGVQMRYLFHEGTYGKTSVRAGADWRAVFLSADAQARIDQYLADNPGASANRDFSQGGVELGLLHRFERPDWAVSGGITASHRLQGGVSAYSGLRLDLGGEYRPGPRGLLHAGLSYEARWTGAAQGPSTRIAAVQFGAVHGLVNGDRLRAIVGLRATDAAPLSHSNLATSLRLGWEKSRPIAGIGLDFGLGAEHRAYPHAIVGREDLSLSADLTLRFTKVEYMGFSPTLTLRAARNLSSARMFDGEELGVSLGWRSNF